MKWFPRVGTLDDVIDWPPHPSPRLCWWHVCSLQLRHQTSHLYDDTCDDVIKGHSHGVAHLIQWPLLLPTAIDVLYAERRSMATFLSPITSRRCVFCGSQGIAKGNYCGSQWVKKKKKKKKDPPYNCRYDSRQSNHVRIYLTNPRNICAWVRLTRIISTVIWRIFLLLLLLLFLYQSSTGSLAWC